MSFGFALFTASCLGFISLCYEVLWFRTFNFETGDHPAAFGLLLGFYLAGLAIGAFLSRRVCQGNMPPRYQQTALVIDVLAATVVGYLVMPAVSFLAPRVPWTYPLLLVALAASLFGATLPLIAHLGIAADSRAGARISYIYFGNIIGSVAGTLIAGYVLSDIWTISQLAVGLAMTGMVITALLVLTQVPNARSRIAALGALVLIASLLPATSPRLFDRFYERLLWKRSDRGARFTDVVENRHGVIAVSNTGRVFGGGGYDGVISTDLVNDRNIIKRAYGVAGFHPHPAQILMIGMSTGAWAQVLANMPGVEHIKIVEINPGYLQLIRKYPQVASILRNAKVEIVIDDGRRWLVHHPDERFDVIVQNSAEHWRAHSTNLMSVEYLRLIRRHLRPNGVFHYNTTWSQDALFTGFTEFPYGIRVVNFAAVSDAPMRFDAARFLEVVREFRIDGKPVFDLTRSADRASFDSLALFATSIDRPPVDYGLERRESTLSRLTGAKTITDDNMLPEWRQLLLVK